MLDLLLVSAVVFSPVLGCSEETFCRWAVSLICRMIFYPCRHFLSLWMYRKAGLCTKQLPACQEAPAASWRWPQARVTAGPWLLLGCSHLPWVTLIRLKGSCEFLLTAPNQVINCWSRGAQNSSILVPFWEKQGQCSFRIMQIAENQSISKTYFISSKW